MKKITARVASFLIPFSLPLIAFAAGKDLKAVIGSVVSYLNTILELLMGIAVVAFVFYVVRYFIMQPDSTKRTEAWQYVLWALVGFFVIFSLWGLVGILTNTFSLQSSAGNWTDYIDSVFPK